MNLIWISAIVLWLIGAVASYNGVISKWENSTVEKLWFSAVWPVVLILYMFDIFNKNL